MQTDTQTLLSAANQYSNNGDGDQQLLKLGLLKQILLNANPMAATDTQSLLSAASQYNNVPAGMWKLLELGLLQQIAAGGGGSGGVLNGNGSPVGVITPTAGLLYINNTDSTLWAVSNGAWTQLV
jgi:hypothetical protein